MRYSPRVNGPAALLVLTKFKRRSRSSPERRYALHEELRRYDLSSEPGLRTYFNREEDTFTEAKLLKIEESVNEE
jgi:hypothetical protein